MTQKSESVLSDEEATSFADFHYSYVSHYIELADVKAGTSFALTAAVLGYLLQSAKFIEAVRFDHGFYLGLVSVFALLSLVISSVLSFLVIAPRSPKGGDEVVFWASVAQRNSSSDYVNAVRGLDISALVTARLSHSYNLSLVCTRKYKMLTKAIWMAAGALSLTLIYWLFV